MCFAKCWNVVSLHSVHHFCCFWFLEFHRNINEKLVPELFVPELQTVAPQQLGERRWKHAYWHYHWNIMLSLQSGKTCEFLPLLWGRKWCRKGEVGRLSLLLERKEEQSFSIPVRCSDRGGWRKKGVGRGTGQKEARNGKMSKAGKGEGKWKKGKASKR